MAELIVAGLAVVSTPPVLFAFEQLHLTLSGKKEGQKPRLGETEDVLPNLLKPKNVVKCNAVEKEDQKPHQGEAKDVFPNLLKPTNVMKGKKGEQTPHGSQAKDALPNLLMPKNMVQDDAVKKEEQKQKLGESKVVLANRLAQKNVAKCNATSKVDFDAALQKMYATQQDYAKRRDERKVQKEKCNATSKDLEQLLFSQQKSSRSTTTGETNRFGMKSESVGETNRFGMKSESAGKSSFSIVEHAATNPYLLKIPSSHHMEQDTTNSYPLKDPISHHMEKDPSTSFFWHFR